MTTHYSAPLADIRFCLYDLLDVEKVFAKLPGCESLNRELIDAVLDEAAKFSQQVLAPLNATGDQEGCKFDKKTGKVKTPKGFKRAYEQYVEGGWAGLTAPESAGGQGLPETLGAPVKEMIDSANLAWGTYPLLSHGATEALRVHGEDWQKEAFLKRIVSGEWTGTMCLTEAHCGSDLGLLKTRAEPNDDGSYAISGTKIFITAGEHDFTDNIVHLVLARLPDAPKGVKGISLFIVPKFKVGKDGKAGDRNAVRCGSIEHKMGLKGSSRHSGAARSFIASRTRNPFFKHPKAKMDSGFHRRRGRRWPRNDDWVGSATRVDITQTVHLHPPRNTPRHGFHPVAGAALRCIPIAEGPAQA